MSRICPYVENIQNKRKTQTRLSKSKEADKTKKKAYVVNTV